MPGERDSGELDRRALLAQVGNHHAVGSLAQCGAFEIVEPPEAYDGVDLAMARERIGTRLREASSHDYAGIGVESPRAPRNPQAFAIGAIRHSAGVDDVNVCRFIEFAAREAARAEPRFDNRGIVLIHFAAECRDRKPHRYTYSRNSRSIKPPPSTSSPR